VSAVRAWEFYLIVSGAGQFPYDMLRYDTCFPVDENAITPRDSEPRRDVLLCSRQFRREWRPTEPRWRSFGWEVVAYGTDRGDAIELMRNRVPIVKTLDAPGVGGAR
jgi:hypothetical protein